MLTYHLLLLAYYLLPDRLLMNPDLIGVNSDFCLTTAFCLLKTGDRKPSLGTT